MRYEYLGPHARIVKKTPYATHAARFPYDEHQSNEKQKTATYIFAILPDDEEDTTDDNGAAREQQRWFVTRPSVTVCV